MVGIREGAAALLLGAIGCVPAKAQVTDAPPTPVAEPSTTRSDEAAPNSGQSDRESTPALDTAKPLPDPQTPTAAQAPGASAANDGRLVYDAKFFSTFAPANALQMVERVPGFTVEVADELVRGFSGAAGNVVINGQRPSSKSDTLPTILQRIPASRVVRIEVGRGDLFGAEFAGKPQVANLVLTSAGGLAGTVEGMLFRDFTGKLYPGGSASALLRRGRSSVNVALGVTNEDTADKGYDRLVLPGTRELVELRRKLNRVEAPRAYASAAYEFNGGENRTAHLNGRVERNLFQLDQTNDVFPAGGPARDDLLFQRYRTHGEELGGDYTVPLAGGGLKLIGLATRKQRRDRDGLFERVQSVVGGGFRQFRHDDRAETLVRVVWNRSNLGPWSVELGTEGVVNRLDSRVDLFDLTGGVRQRIDLPIDDATVKETRGEVFANVGRPLSKTLRIDLGVTYEASDLRVSGDAQAKRVLTFLKPRATLDWRAESGWHAQASVKRTVAQLQFEDFISVAELANERVNGGNANLVPQRAWEVLGFVERPVLGDGLVRLELGYNMISLVQDRVPTPEGFDAPGNLGDGELFLARGRVDAPLVKFGIKGGRATLSTSYVKTSVRDPYTFDRRPFSGNAALVVDFDFRQDLAKFAWGVTLSANTPSTFYRLDETDKSIPGIPYSRVFAEYRPTRRTTVTFGLDNAIATPYFRTRTFYFPDRRQDEPDLIERRKRNQYIKPYLQLKHSFG